MALRNRAAHVLAIGDIVEPVEEWRRLKFEKLRRQWDYVFRRLFYTHTPNVRDKEFARPLEIASVEKTAGHITNLDLFVDASGAAHLLYLRVPHQYAFIRDRYFPGQPMSRHLEYAVVVDGKVTSSRTLAETPLEGGGLEPGYGRFHVGPGERLYVVVAGHRKEGGRERSFGNFIAPIDPEASSSVFRRLPLEHPFRRFFTSTPRGGSRPSPVLDMFGIADDSPHLRYARVDISRLSEKRTARDKLNLAPNGSFEANFERLGSWIPNEPWLLHNNRWLLLIAFW